MRHILVFMLLALAVVGIATAARGDPQKQFTPADQARAKAMLLRKADVGPGYRASKPSDDEFDFYCKALDESHLVLTGEAEGLDFEKGALPRAYLSVSSLSQVYKTTAQSAESWRQGTSAAGMRCLKAGFQKMAKEIGPGTTLVSFRKTAFPRVAPGTVAVRIVFRIVTVRMVFDWVVLRNGRGQAGPIFAGAPSAYPRAEEVRLSRIVAGRMAEAMGRG